MDATMREFLLASARITTQCREYERTHGEDRRERDELGAAGFAGEAVRDLDANAPSVAGAVMGATSAMTVGGATVSRTATSASAVVVRDGALSEVATTGCGAIVSLAGGADAVRAAGADRPRATS